MIVSNPNPINSTKVATENVKQTKPAQTEFSTILDETIQAIPNANFSNLELKLANFSEAQMAQAISLETYLDGLNASAPNYNIKSYGATAMHTTQELSNLNNSTLFSTNQYDDIIVAESQKNGLDPLLVKSIIKHESGFNTNAVSSAGAAGLMQLMPANVRHFDVSSPFNAGENIAAGTKLFKQCYDMYDGNLTLALAAYNAGPGNVKKYGGVPPFNETQNYIQRVLGTYEKATSL